MKARLAFAAVAMIVAAGVVAGAGGDSPSGGVAGSSPTFADPPDLLSIRVIVQVDSVAFGQAFSLTVVRGWKRSLMPEPWDDAALAPLAVRLTEATRQENEGRIIETRRYRAYAFERSKVKIPPVTLRVAVGVGPVREVTSEPIELIVTSSLLADDEGAAELPGPLFPRPFRWQDWIVLVTFVMALIGAGFWSFSRWIVRRREAASAPAPPAQLARARLHALAEDDAGRNENIHDEVASVLRTYLGDALGIGPAGRSTEEHLASADVAAALDDVQQVVVGRVLEACDRARFGGVGALGSNRESDDLLADAARFVDLTSRDEEAGS
ncbi:MAG: hypothetical protein CMJ83_01750 [Planctomycetes bacterium]|nr:hypothetical protein [Planctomycetota bacterium]